MKREIMGVLVVLLFCCLFWGCTVRQEPHPPVSRYVSDCDRLAEYYGANVITIRDGNSYVGYARLHSPRQLAVWRSSGKTATKDVSAGSIWELELAIADEMRFGVMPNPNPPRPRGPNDDLFGHLEK